MNKLELRMYGLVYLMVLTMGVRKIESEFLWFLY
jgi:hypothetical protein